MAQPQLLQIKLSRFDAQPWGFRLQGGVDFASPLVVQKVNGGSLAEKAGLIPGDAVLQINDVDVFNLRHKDAQDVVVRSGNNFVLTVQRGGSTWRPHVTPTGNLPQPQQNSPYLQTVTKTSLAHKQQEGQHIGCGYNNAARPFVNGGDGSVKSIVNKQYNTPVGIYSDESIAETLSAQAEVLAGGVLGVNFKKNEKEYQPDKSEVLKFLREEETGQSTPAFQQDYQHQHQNHHQHLHHQQQQPQQQQQQQQHYQPSATRHVSAPVNSSKPPSTGGLPTGQNICHECERLITGVFVRIKDKNLHVECFKCATCGTSLKNQGYYNYNNKLYCDIHAKLAALQNPPPGTDGYVPVPIKPNAKLSANTISSALNAHGFSDIPVANGGVATQNSVPRPQAYESANENKEDNTDLPLPPPPSPSLLQQLEIDSQYCAAVDDNTTDTKQKLLHTSRHSTLSTSSNNSSRTSAAQPSHIPSMTEEISTAPMVDETSSGYTSASSLRSRQTSSAPSSVCGTSTDSNRTPIASPPPPPPLPPSLPVQMIQQPHRQPCENDMNSQNQHGIGGGLAGGVYSKFLKEYSNKLLTQNNKNNISTNSLSIDISSKSNHKHYEKSNKSLVTNNIQNRLNNTALPYHPSTQTLMTSHAQSVKNLDSIASGLISTTTDAVPGIDTASATTKNTHPSVIAISANFTNQLNPCQQVAKSATDSTLPPPALLSSTPKTEITSATLINAVNSNCHSHISNRCESAQLSEFEGIPDTAREATSAMLANQPSELDQSPFGEYVTLTGSVIRSVVPPGKGTNINYKVNQGYARPFGAASGAPASAPKSPVAYPPQRSAVNPYATLPRNNVGQQDNDPSLQPQYAEECDSTAAIGAEYFEEDLDLADANRQNRNNFSWPPPKEDSPVVPTAAPLYIPPPETQHAVAKPLKIPQPQSENELNKGQSRSQNKEQQQVQYCQPNWQSKSAPQLTIGLQPPEIESSSESFTSTSTTTTTTSEEYQRMYAAQVQAYQMQQVYEQQSGSELDYHMDMEVATMQQNLQESSCISSSEYISGRRSAQECVESLAAPLNTYKLIDMVREVTPSPIPPPNNLGPKHVVFLDEPETKEIPAEVIEENLPEETKSGKKMTSQTETTTSDTSERNDIERKNSTIECGNCQKNKEEGETFVKTQRSEILECQRIFQPTPEIKIEIPPVRQIPPSKIPNPVPKEWINPLVRVLTTAPDVPFHLVECPCPKPCDCEFVALETDKHIEETIKREEVKQTEVPEEIKPIEEDPPKGSRLASAMTTAPEWEVHFQPPPSEMIPLPEETTPYMPPPIDMKPYMREDYRPKSPFLSALTTAPERPFEGHFDRDVPIHLLDLPTPKEHLTLSDALRTAPERAYTPLNPANFTHLFEEQEIEKEKKKHEFQVLDREKELGITALDSESIQYYTTEKRNTSQQRKSSAFAAMQAFQPTQAPLISNTPCQSITSYSKHESDPDYERYYKAKERNKKRIDYYHKKEEELQQQQVQEIKILDTSQTKQCQSSSLNSYTKQSSSSASSSAVQTESNTTSTSTYASNSTQASSSSYQSNAGTALSDTKIDLQEVIDETTEELEHSEVLFPPPSPLSHLQGKAVMSGLHKADTIPKYQRNWTKLPTQSPVRTPEPSELRENIPLAFVDSPAANSSSNPVHKPVAQISTTTANESKRQEQSSLTEQRTKSQTQTKRPVVPVIVEDRVTPQVTMAFQSLDEHLQLDESQRPNRPYTPSISNKPVPIIPFYQTPEALCFDECPASHARTYDRRSASPFPDRARSPAPGPPPNPLAAIRTPRVKDNELSSLSPRILQAGSITTGQSYLGAQQQQQTEIISHLEQTSKTGSQSYTKIPERIQEHQIGNYTVQRQEKASHKSDQKQSSLESQTKMQIGDTQIERRRRVTEEYEHTQSARSVEIRTGTKTTAVAPASSATERRQSYGKTGYVANQARRLSGLEQEITNLTSQSQAISARAAALTDTSFPQISSPEPVSKFPTKPLLPPHDEPKRPSYLFSATPYNKMVGPPPGFNEQENEQKQNQQQLSSFHALTTYGASMASKQQKSLSTYSSSNFTTSTSTASSLSQQANAANVSSLTKASITNNNQADAASATTAAASAICPVTGTFCRPGHTCCRQQQLQAQTIATGVVNYTENNNVTYRPNASTGITDIKTNAQTTATAIATAANAIAYATDTAPPSSSTGSAAAAAPTSFPPPNTIDNNKSNVDFGGSTGVGGKGAFGATSAPKRGRGIFNKAVGPGVRVPLCNSCNIQIRGPFITALGRIWCPEHFICVNANCRRPLQDIGFVEEKGDLYCEYCFEKYLAPTCSKCGGKIKGDCLNAIGKQFHPECFTCGHCGKLFGNTPFFLEDGNAYCEADWNELFTTKCFACGFPVEAGDRWVEALNHNYHSQCFNCTYCKQNLEGQSFYNKGGRPFCKNHAR
ncbi:PREDICTED: PDZ and LIM domain protein Zasp isoform X1 [Rhagoletis zephyria]|uniref:PDZ and LIM domain protein Zasp isoform X1 n=1 Tax=Rhagoletis zephyria TaxID=28612 RepID=UPI0008112190|nr:PREDICTED: PDZ and LIM domain protein Zasp isoform X1 [Rhagoletis zephyria]XP_017484092.1 PREDICTED: PDZ and LIM domain protein Zasp isoform X1 [Rhagoletis zephyria]XP_017484102.1 PREDICTED: PDZ and LIM domain protein Zasp isoform X1 [Rhagoletis zephyria]XP_017484110.1 PREDICTED: PDZ and LIM domain protein Zasp isoform X1 [Rhagoletis zephyria]XP_017484117.1 PREDICTED: PDZ and LIM domain protein Zasp isoform X1 [Rhagoletis zephyria]XP_017484125.1 PREDICTED: PDZ and LIM domain protein Zasp is